MKSIPMSQSCIFIFLLVSSQLIMAQAPYGNAGEHTAVTLENTYAPNGYYEYLPTDFDQSSGNTYALVLFFHGKGERGDGNSNLDKVLKHGPPKLIENGTDFPAIVISAQSPKNSGTFSPSDFTNLYEYIIANYPIDLNRVYVTGLSAGGGSTWNALRADYTKIAAAIPICGAGGVNDPSGFLQQTPIWAHHNFSDGTVGRGQTINNMNRIANTGNSVMEVYPYGTGGTVADSDYTMQFDTTSKIWSSAIGINSPSDKMSFTLYRNGGHDAWTKTYNNQDVWDWLFAQSLNTLSTEEFVTISTKIYPNPTSGNIIIKTQKTLEEKLEIYDTVGRKIYDRMVTNNEVIDIASHGSGIYIAKIITSLGSQNSFKIVVR
ncbi:T9SS C-terminal target domain-containing protein [Aquimarina sp. BL5]|uniref:T9SS type A sorting domain-containing protein n=1 Tax=Aquimarina sp. BL5 TaxID=1714860 RepID=UPI000E53F1CF|nr:T9SS type A sorting domain-containing protein [Aquimarina sp. BL5]AXT52748.1 T9SS C-terminal target domain-containing protein [Aquimarina sp. BL5]RKN00011.1 T9SS C-terminal target domain-containing protein [Aquimarina sp. BL5]